MNTFKKYFLTICATTYSGVFFLRIFHYGFIYENPIQIIKGCVPTVLITLGLILICSCFQWPLLNKFDEMIEKDHGATAICHFCCDEYHFTEDELREIEKEARES